MIINSQVYREDNMLLLQHHITIKMPDTFLTAGFVGNGWVMSTNFFRIVEKGYNLRSL